MTISVHQIYFSQETQKHLEPEFIPYLNERKDGYFENTVIKDIYEQNIQADYIGISSWKQHIKTRFTGKEILDFMKKDISEQKEKDVYLYPAISNIKINYDNNNVNGIITEPSIWSIHKESHKKAYEIDELLNKSNILPFDIFDGKWNYCHCNYWIARKKVFDEYCEKILLPVMNWFEREDVRKLTGHPSYLHPHENKSYPFYSFVIEGLFGAFMAHANYSYSYICKKRINKKIKMINILNY